MFLLCIWKLYWSSLLLPPKLSRFTANCTLPEGDNDLAESRKYLDPQICTKGNFKLNLLREGTPAQIAELTHQMVESVRGWKHIISTADAVLPGTPPENFVAFIEAAHEFSYRS